MENEKNEAVLEEERKKKEGYKPDEKAVNERIRGKTWTWHISNFNVTDFNDCGARDEFLNLLLAKSAVAQ